MSAARSIPIDDMTTPRAVARAEARAERLELLAFARNMIVPLLEASTADVADAEAHIVEAVDELEQRRDTRDRLAQLLFRILSEEETLDPIRVQAACFEVLDGG